MLYTKLSKFVFCMDMVPQTAQNIPVRLEMCVHAHLCLLHHTQISDQLIFQNGITSGWHLTLWLCQQDQRQPCKP